MLKIFLNILQKEIYFSADHELLDQEYLLTDKKTKDIVKFLKTKNGLILNFQRAIYQF